MHGQKSTLKEMIVLAAVIIIFIIILSFLFKDKVSNLVDSIISVFH
ncbi:MAG: hypothetical protein V1725_06250 [archaeon]